MVTKKQAAEVLPEQFPSLSGAESVEVAKRSQDVNDLSTSSAYKVFVLLKRQYENGDQSAIHENNIRAFRQYMEGQGLRPADDGRFVGAEDNVDGLSINLTYAVAAEPAIVAQPPVSNAPADPAQDVTPPNPDRQPPESDKSPVPGDSTKQ